MQECAWSYSDYSTRKTEVIDFKAVYAHFIRP